MWCVGKCVRAYSFEPLNSYGKKATLPTLREKKPLKKLKDPVSKLKIHELILRLKTLSGVKEVAHHTLDEFDSEIKFGQLSGDDYARVRLDVYREIYEERADWLDWVLLFYKVATYGIGAVSGFLSYMGLEVNPPPTLSRVYPHPFSFSNEAS